MCAMNYDVVASVSSQTLVRRNNRSRGGEYINQRVLKTELNDTFDDWTEMILRGAATTLLCSHLDTRHQGLLLPDKIRFLPSPFELLVNEFEIKVPEQAR